MGGRFTLSDDSHGVVQVGLNYDKMLDCIKEASITELCFLAPASDSILPHDPRFPKVGWKTISVAELEQHSFWKR
jgi:histidinol-phosphatase (PHP family)